MPRVYRNTALVVRTTQDPGTVVPAVRAALGKIGPAQPLVNVRTMETAVAGSVAQPHLRMVLLIVFAVLAVALAVVGVYGVMAYAVSQRIPEIGIRMAVGASPNRVVRMVVLEGARLAGTGLALGLVASVFAARALQQLVCKMHDLDPLIFAVAPLALGAAALAASGIPAFRAARVSPFLAIHQSRRRQGTSTPPAAPASSVHAGGSSAAPVRRAASRPPRRGRRSDGNRAPGTDT